LKTIWLVLAGCALVALVAGVLLSLRRQTTLEAAAQGEARRMEPEIRQCRERLAQLHEAWQRYQADHHGAEPPSVESLVPRYVRSPDLLVCPTAARWTRDGGAVEEGSIQIGRRNYPVSYGCRWLTSGYPRLVKLEGNRAPVISCDVHRQVIYQAAYHRPPPLGVFDEPARSQLARAVAAVGLLVVRRDGEVGMLKPGED
jgi:hypothetical protein